MAENNTADTIVTEETANALDVLQGWQTIDGKKYFYGDDGAIQTGWFTDNSGTYYLNPKDGGAAVSGLKKIGSKYYYFNPKTNILVKNKKYVKIGSKYYDIDKTGAAKALSKVEILAEQRLRKQGGTLWGAFQWSAKLGYRGAVNVPKGQSAAEYCGLWGFQRGAGDCYVQAYTFYWMAKRQGYDVKVIRGYVPQANGKYGTHAWCEIKSGGKTYVYDPNFAYSYGIQKGNSAKIGYKFSYGAKGHYKYCDSKKKEIKKK